MTIQYDVPNGIESPISLVPLLKINKELIKKHLDKICRSMNLSYYKLIESIKEIPTGIIPYTLPEWGIPECDLSKLVDASFTKGRMDNNIVGLTKTDVQLILEKNYL